MLEACAISALPQAHLVAEDFCDPADNIQSLILSYKGVEPWTAIALHTTPGIPEFMHPVVALLTCGVEMDVLGIAHDQYRDEVRNAVVAEYPRTPNFKEDIIQAFYDGFHKRPDSTFGTVNADVIADKDSKFARGNFCSIIRNSAWR